jgi:membrane fusion protein, multidrug efflux system
MENTRTKRFFLLSRAQNSKKTLRRILKGICLLWVGTVFLSGCSETNSEVSAGKPAAPVIIETVALKNVPVQVRAIGNVEPYNTVGIRAQVGGNLSRVHFSEGEEVKKGSLLFTIDSRQYEAALKQAEAALARDRAQFENAKKDAARYAELVHKGYVSQEQYEQLRTNAEALESVVQSHLAQVENAKVQLGYCFIYAPVGGRTGSLLLHEGNLVKANADTPLIVIHQIEPVNVTFTIPEKQFPEIRKYTGSGKLQVEAFLSAEDTIPAKGNLSFTDNTVDRATGTIMMKAVFPNRDRRLWPGQFVNVVMTLAIQQNVTVIPSAAVQTGQDGEFVYTVKGNTAELRPVQTGSQHEGMTVILKGLSAGEQVITDGQMRLVPGSKIVAINSEAGGSEQELQPESSTKEER